MSFDQSLFEAIHGIAGTSGALDTVGIFFARVVPFLIVAAFLVFLLLESDWKIRFRTFATVLISVILSRWIIGATVQFFYSRVRPPTALHFEPLILNPSSPSFPSGHALILFALAGAVFFLNRRWGIWLFAAASLVGIARIFVGVHWPTDVIGGLVIGSVSAFAAWKLLRETREKTSV